MIELTPEQRQAMKEQNGEPVAVVDPSTHEIYVLLRADVYRQRTWDLPPLPHEPPAEMDPWLLRSMQAFWRDLPALLQKKRNKGKWVAYNGDEQVAFGKTQTDVYQECFRRGLQREQFYVGKIEEDDTPPWGTFQGESGLYEFTDVRDGTIPPDSA